MVWKVDEGAELDLRERLGSRKAQKMGKAVSTGWSGQLPDRAWGVRVVSSGDDEIPPNVHFSISMPFAMWFASHQETDSAFYPLNTGSPCDLLPDLLPLSGTPCLLLWARRCASPVDHERPRGPEQNQRSLGRPTAAGPMRTCQLAAGPGVSSATMAMIAVG